MNDRYQTILTVSIVLGILMILYGISNMFTRTSIRPRADYTSASANEAPLSGGMETLASVPEGRYTYGGSATMVQVRQIVEPMIDDIFPQFRLSYVQPLNTSPSSTLGINMLLEGELSFSDSSRALKPDEYEAAETLGFELQQIPVAVDGIAVVVHSDLLIDGLNLDQLSDIFLGNITNWSEVGGPDLEIRPFSMLPSKSGTANFFIQRILNGNDLGERVEIVNETTPILRQVASNPGSIYYVSASLAVPQCSVKTLPLATAAGRPFIPPYQVPPVEPEKCPEQRNQINKDAIRNGTYPLTRRLFVVAKKGDSADALAGQAYSDILLSAEGQLLLEQAGFVNIR